MSDTTIIYTPDHVELEFELAGPGARGGALAIDLILTTLIKLAIFFALVFSGLLSVSFTGASPMLLSLLILAFFLIDWGYFIFFEILMKGQTPGKRCLGIRVVKDNGLPMGVREAVVRNLLRVADMLPFPSYLLGIIVAGNSEKSKRLGDMVAGTIVTRERFILDLHSNQWGANWISRLERGESRHALNLPVGQITIRQLEVINRFLDRAHTLPTEKRDELAWNLVAPYMDGFGVDVEELRKDFRQGSRCEALLRRLVAMAEEETSTNHREVTERQPNEKMEQWRSFGERLNALLGAPRRLSNLTAAEMDALMQDYRGIVADLARARSLSSDSGTLSLLNRLACMGHHLLYTHYREPVQAMGTQWLGSFARAVRAHLAPFAMSAGLFFVPALISYIALHMYPGLAYEIVSEGFLNFESASAENIHDIPSLSRPFAATAITTNNIQVTFLAFALGLTFGIGTAYVLILNGVHIGAVAGWFALRGESKALWGWIMPHGGTEILAILLAGAAGLILARAMIAPGRLKRVNALREAGIGAMKIELGCMFMLVIAGLIEGFVSPSNISYSARIAIIVFSLLFWFFYFAFAGRKPADKTTT